MKKILYLKEFDDFVPYSISYSRAANNRLASAAPPSSIVTHHHFPETQNRTVAVMSRLAEQREQLIIRISGKNSSSPIVSRTVASLS